MRIAILAAVAASFALPAFADPGITITDAYVRTAGPGAKTGASFMVIENHSDTDDRLIDAASDAAMRVELHTHRMGADGMMQMLHVEEGFVIPAEGTHELARGGDHVMLMGLTGPLAEGSTVTFVLTFEKAGEITLDATVDSSR